jgi:hypothetical protein
VGQRLVKDKKVPNHLCNCSGADLHWSKQTTLSKWITLPRPTIPLDTRLGR